MDSTPTATFFKHACQPKALRKYARPAYCRENPSVPFEMSKKNIQISRIKDAYSLIEIVIAIAILGILMVIGALSYSNSMFTGNDAVRISDLERIKTALRNEKQKT